MPPGTGQIPLAAAQKPAELRAAVEDDLAELGLDRVHVVNLRRLDLGPGLRAEGDQLVDLDDQLAELIALRDEGKIGAGDLVLDADALARLDAGYDSEQDPLANSDGLEAFFDEVR